MTDDEAGAEAVFAAFEFGIGKHAPQGFKSGLADVGARDRDGGESGLGVFGEKNIIEADNGKVGRYLETAVVSAVKDADCGKVIAGENGGGRIGAQKFGAGDIAALDGEIGVDDAGRVDAKTLHGVNESLFTAVNGNETGRASDIGDARMAQGGEVFQRLGDAVPIIENNIADGLRDFT